MNVESVEVTLDGIEEFHDTHRYTKENLPSFKLIFENLKTILNRPDFKDLKCRITIRCNVDEDNREGVYPLIDLLAKEGLDSKISYFYPIGIYSWGNDAHLNSLNKDDFAKRELDWYAYMLQYDFAVGVLPARKKVVCMSVNPNSDVYDADGNIYNCTEIAYVPTYDNSDYISGNLANQDSYKRNMITDWNDTLLAKKYPCSSCQLLPVCGGACPKSWHEDMRACPPFKFNIKEKLLFTYLHNKRANFSEQEKEELILFHIDKTWVKRILYNNKPIVLEA